MPALAIALTLALTLALTAAGCGRACRQIVRTYTLDAAQIARVTEGSGAPTPRGCEVVCDEQFERRDASTVDGGLPASIFSDIESCTLAGAELTCTNRVRCAI